MNAAITLVVCSQTGAATALAEMGRRRAADLGLVAEIIRTSPSSSPRLPRTAESVTAIVPTEFASAQHEAWCLLCQLSLLRAEVDFAILVLGAAGSSDFEARQKALLDSVRAAPSGRRARSRRVA